MVRAQVKMENATSCRSKIPNSRAFGVEIETSFSPFAAPVANHRPGVGLSMTVQQMSRKMLIVKFSASRFFENATGYLVRSLGNHASRSHHNFLHKIFEVVGRHKENSTALTLKLQSGHYISFSSTHNAQIGQGRRRAERIEDCDE
jgi:hypothetical protein